MKKISILLVLVVVQLTFASENDSLVQMNPFKRQLLLLEDDCDACGCAASGGSMGFASMLNTNFLGIRYFNQSYKSTNGLYRNSPWYNENFNTAQIWARIPVMKSFQFSSLIPYHFHNREIETGGQSISGIGDITVLGMYTLFQTHNDSMIFVHNLQLGGGVKLPTGKFDEANYGSVNPSYQLGTGSWDYLLATEYSIKRKKFGLNALLNYVIKTENEKKYRFGNQFNYAGTFFYIHQKDSFSLAPQIGFAGELYADNYQHGQKVRNTAGDIFMGKVGFEIGKDKFSFGTNVILPINQNLTGGRVEAKYRWSINLNYSL
jgi:hypothetical protein